MKWSLNNDQMGFLGICQLYIILLLFLYIKVLCQFLEVLVLFNL